VLFELLSVGLCFSDLYFYGNGINNIDHFVQLVSHPMASSHGQF